MAGVVVLTAELSAGAGFVAGGFGDVRRRGVWAAAKLSPATEISMVMMILFRFMKASFCWEHGTLVRQGVRTTLSSLRSGLPIICDRVSMAKLSCVSSGDEVSTESGSDRGSSLLYRAVEGLEPGRYRSGY